MVQGKLNYLTGIINFHSNSRYVRGNSHGFTQTYQLGGSLCRPSILICNRVSLGLVEGTLERFLVSNLAHS